MRRLIKFLWATRYVIVAVISILGVMLVFNLVRMFMEEDVNIFLFILTVVGFGLGVSLFAIVDYLHSNLPFETLSTKKGKTTLEQIIKEQSEAFMNEYSKQRQEKRKNVVDAEFIEQDEFAGDAVYDNIDNIFEHTKRVVRTDRDHIVDDFASLTVLELKTLCRENGISGFSRMKKHELVKALEELDKEKSSL